MCGNCNGCEQVKKVKAAFEVLVEGLKEVGKKGVPYVKKIIEAVEEELNKDSNEENKG